jgi:catechol 2,3-dioxygenase-like lactoylglutathione lyase family enzyme
MSTPKPAYAPIGLQHVNLSVPPGTLPLAQAFYGTVLGLANDAVPELQRDVLLWFALGGGQQVSLGMGRSGTRWERRGEERRLGGGVWCLG